MGALAKEEKGEKKKILPLVYTCLCAGNGYPEYDLVLRLDVGVDDDLLRQQADETGVSLMKEL